MSFTVAERITRALLYEGYVLYPYTRSSTKNQQRWTFGGVYPPAYVEQNPGADASMIRSECLLKGCARTSLEVRVRFLHLRARSSGEGGWDDWEEACEREIRLRDIRADDLLAGPQTHPFAFAVGEEEIQKPLFGKIELSLIQESDDVLRFGVSVLNVTDAQTPSRREALLHTMVSTHILMSVEDGRFISLLDPGETFQPYVNRCRNQGVWPVLVGRPGEAKVMVASPIILYDYPEVAPESPGDFFDAAEIDELLSLRVLTLTDSEKEEMKRSDPRASSILERVEALSEDDWLKLHGRLRDLSTPFERGDRVRVLPRKYHGPGSNLADALDIVLAGLTAHVETVEHSLEGGIYLGVTIDDDPGRDLGEKGQPGHRFYFRPDEVERL